MYFNTLNYKRLKSNWSDTDSIGSFEERRNATLLNNKASSLDKNSGFLSYSSLLTRTLKRKINKSSKMSLIEPEKSSLYSSTLPIILITDTSSMQTSIIDLDTFEPDDEKFKFNSSHSLLNYYFENRIPKKVLS